MHSLQQDQENVRSEVDMWNTNAEGAARRAAAVVDSEIDVWNMDADEPRNVKQQQETCNFVTE